MYNTELDFFFCASLGRHICELNIFTYNFRCLMIFPSLISLWENSYCHLKWSTTMSSRGFNLRTFWSRLMLYGLSYLHKCWIEVKSLYSVLCLGFTLSYMVCRTWIYIGACNFRCGMYSGLCLGCTLIRFVICEFTLLLVITGVASQWKLDASAQRYTPCSCACGVCVCQ
jgi:hypothetical protein